MVQAFYSLHIHPLRALKQQQQHLDYEHTLLLLQKWILVFLAPLPSAYL
ncbi:hypothetical protein ADG881_2521 [Alcanivorax sp. DG881]|nr:hypothetical protein ADG881_2521 [Alcanivorax sp. DG881]